ncbi:zinc finger protein 782-like [Acanthaster planci]|uniref:Zinc finger protein 782-like n=1 Tax=Acanthaster planci TaxID=133434 RepID=A0A8B7ZBA2_ACAPL|nr:zinc finger protein 782-like [Acanthaster planci]
MPPKTTNRKIRQILPKTPVPEEKPCKKSRNAKNESHVCETCSKEYTRVSRYRAHVRLHTGELPFACSSCDKRFRCAESLNTHKAVHSNERSFACDQCSRKYKTSHQLRKHQRLVRLAVSRGEPNDHSPVKCKLCSFRIMSKSEGRRHARTHRKKQRPYVCSFCKARFGQLEELGRHERKRQCLAPADGDAPAEIEDCRKCRKIFGGGSSSNTDPQQQLKMACRLQHIHQIHSYSKAPRHQTCHRCGEKFTSGRSLGRHLATHFEIDLYRCNSCHTEFKDKASYKEHDCSKMPNACGKPILVVKFLPHVAVREPDVFLPTSILESEQGAINSQISQTFDLMTS